MYFFPLGILVVYYEANNTEPSGFNATYTVHECYPPCEPNKMCRGQSCVCKSPLSGPYCLRNVCPRNCSADVGRGVCNQVRDCWRIPFQNWFKANSEAALPAKGFAVLSLWFSYIFHTAQPIRWHTHFLMRPFIFLVQLFTFLCHFFISSLLVGQWMRIIALSSGQGAEPGSIEAKLWDSREILLTTRKVRTSDVHSCSEP